MLARFVVASLLPLSLSLAMGGATAQAGQTNPQRNAQCQAHFDANKSAIEALAASGDSAGIKAMMGRGSCPTGTIALPATPSAKSASIKIECKTLQLYPTVNIECTISLGIMRKSEKR